MIGARIQTIHPYYPKPTTQDLPKIPIIVDLYWNIEWLKISQ